MVFRPLQLFQMRIVTQLKPNSITLADSQLVRSWSQTGSTPNSITLSDSKLVGDELRTSFEPASVMEFGFYAAVGKISTNTGRRAVPLRQLSLLMLLVIFNYYFSVKVQCGRLYVSYMTKVNIIVLLHLTGMITLRYSYRQRQAYIQKQLKTALSDIIWTNQVRAVAIIYYFEAVTVRFVS